MWKFHLKKQPPIIFPTIIFVAIRNILQYIIFNSCREMNLQFSKQRMAAFSTVTVMSLQSIGIFSSKEARK